MSNNNKNYCENLPSGKVARVAYKKCETNDNQNTANDSDKKGLAGYGSQSGEPHPFYRTTSKEYGWFPPDYHTAPSVYYPMQQKFSSHLAAAGMYRNHSLNTSMDPPPYK